MKKNLTLLIFLILIIANNANAQLLDQLKELGSSIKLLIEKDDNKNNKKNIKTIPQNENISVETVNTKQNIPLISNSSNVGIKQFQIGVSINEYIEILKTIYGHQWSVDAGLVQDKSHKYISKIEDVFVDKLKCVYTPVGLNKHKILNCTQETTLLEQLIYLNITFYDGKIINITNQERVPLKIGRKNFIDLAIKGFNKKYGEFKSVTIENSIVENLDSTILDNRSNEISRICKDYFKTSNIDENSETTCYLSAREFKGNMKEVYKRFSSLPIEDILNLKEIDSSKIKFIDNCGGQCDKVDFRNFNKNKARQIVQIMWEDPTGNGNVISIIYARRLMDDLHYYYQIDFNNLIKQNELKLELKNLETNYEKNIKNIDNKKLEDF